MNSNGMTEKRGYSKAEEGTLPLRGAIKAKHQRTNLLWALVLCSVLFVLVAPFKPSTLLSGSVANTSGKQTVEEPAVTNTELTGNGRTNDVLWDKYSLVLKGQRIFIQ